MSSIFFKLSPLQQQEVNQLMKEEGYTSKAEFFRFLIKFFKYTREQNVQRKLKITTEELATLLIEAKERGMLNATLEEQLADV